MTLIIYKENQIAGDRLAVVSANQWSMHSMEHRKVFLSYCGQLGYGVSGILLDEVERPQVELLLLQLIDTAMRVGEFKLTSDMRDLLLTEKREYTIMTSEHTYQVGDSGVLRRAVAGEICVTGNCGTYGILAAKSGLSAAEAVAAVAASGITSECALGMTTVNRSELRAFVGLNPPPLAAKPQSTRTTKKKVV